MSGTKQSDRESQKQTDQCFMQRALELAGRAGQSGEVPVGAVAVHAGEIVAEAYNQCIALSDPGAHAEMLVLRAAGRRLENYRLPGVTLYVTIEPCTMCFGAMVHARIDRLVYGAPESKGGVITSNLALHQSPHYNHSIEVYGGLLADEAKTLMQDFFKARRAAR